VNTLLEKSSRMGHHTDLRLVFEALGGRGREFNWLLTDIELNYYPPGLTLERDVGRSKAKWLEGAELTDIVDANDVQFIWGVLSGFRPGVVIGLPAFRSSMRWRTSRLCVGIPRPQCF